MSGDSGRTSSTWHDARVRRLPQTPLRSVNGDEADFQFHSELVSSCTGSAAGFPATTYGTVDISCAATTGSVAVSDCAVSRLAAVADHDGFDKSARDLGR